MDEERNKQDAEAAALWAKEHGVTRIEGGKWIRGGKVVKEAKEPEPTGDTSPWGWGNRTRGRK